MRSKTRFYRRKIADFRPQTRFYHASNKIQTRFQGFLWRKSRPYRRHIPIWPYRGVPPPPGAGRRMHFRDVSTCGVCMCFCVCGFVKKFWRVIQNYFQLKKQVPQTLPHILPHMGYPTLWPDPCSSVFLHFSITSLWENNGIMDNSGSLSVETKWNQRHRAHPE